MVQSVNSKLPTFPVTAHVQRKDSSSRWNNEPQTNEKKNDYWWLEGQHQKCSTREQYFSGVVHLRRFFFFWIMNLSLANEQVQRGIILKYLFSSSCCLLSGKKSFLNSLLMPFVYINYRRCRVRYFGCPEAAVPRTSLNILQSASHHLSKRAANVTIGSRLR